MAALPHGENGNNLGSVVSADNPYHFSFKICALEASGGPDHGKNASQNSQNTKYRDTYYDEYLKEKSDYYCELCDRGFRNESQLSAHNAEHVTCGRDGCKFTAHEKIVANHVRVQHVTGIFSKIKKLDNPEEIKKWLEERRRKYPTIKVAQNKVKLAEAKKKRGETIETPKNRFNKEFSRSKNCKSQRGLKRKNKGCNKKNKLVRDSSDDESKEDLFNGSIPAFKGVGLLAKEIDETPKQEMFNISDEEDYHAIPVQINSMMANNSLGLLMNAYDSDASDEPETVPPQLPPAPQPATQTQPIPISDDEAPDEVPTTKCCMQPSTTPMVENVKPRRTKSNHSNKREIVRDAARFVRRRRQPTLLEKLLSNDINRERNIIRECAHYIVKNNFFQDNSINLKKKAKKSERKFVERKSRLLKNLLQDDIVRERNFIMQCVRFTVRNNFFDDSNVSFKCNS